MNIRNIFFTLLILISGSINAQDTKSNFEEVVFGAGCFWCVEGIFETIEGVEDVVSGYSGGNEKTATYKQTSTGTTDHAEVVKITYDPAVVSYECLLKIFFDSHDPTTLNRQGPDRGREYRSVIFYNDEEEKAIAASLIKKLDAEKAFQSKIVTTLEPFKAFYKAESYHQDFKKLNKNHPYIIRVSVPRLEAFKQKHKGCE